MPRLSCWFIRAALVHLGVGVVMGGLILSAKGLPAMFGWAWLLLSSHIQLLVGGWLIQLALGMAYWMLPRLDAAGDRGRPAAAWTCWGALNTGVVGTAAALTARSFAQGAWLDGVLVLAALLQLVALVAFAWHAWPRLQPITVPTPVRQSGTTHRRHA
jgi:hypothetical protein